MSEEFPPQAEHIREVESLVEVFASVVEGRSALYASSPLTTGQRAFDWHRRSGSLSGIALTKRDADAFRREVLEPNRVQAARFAQDLRQRTGRLVIDPTAVEDLPAWTQADYHVLWGRVIERYADVVVFRDGWQHSSGCAYEFFAACTSGSQLFREDLTPLAREEGRVLLADAVDENRARGISGEFLQRVLKALSEPAASDSER